MTGCVPLGHAPATFWMRSTEPGRRRTDQSGHLHSGKGPAGTHHRYRGISKGNFLILQSFLIVA